MTIFNKNNKVSVRLEAIALSVTALLSVTSCSGFLDILP